MTLGTGVRWQRDVRSNMPTADYHTQVRVTLGHERFVERPGCGPTLTGVI